MSDRWRDFLEGQGLFAGPDGHSHGDAENIDAFQKLTGDALCDLSHLALVRAAGADAEGFLQNQLTNDIAALDEHRSALAGYCNPKGRLICIFRIRRDGDGFALQLPSEVQESSMQRLRKYVLRAKVNLSIADDQASFGICGKTVAKSLEPIVGRVPARDNEWTQSGDLTVVRVPGGSRPRFQVIGPTGACIAAWKKLAPLANVMGSWVWARLDILAGIPNVAAKTSESFVPQMVNLDLLDGVNFRKGCYPGQEIVARMHYLGNLKQRMARFRVDDEDRPEPGDRVHTPGGGSAAGTIMDAQPSAGSGWDLLAVVRLADIDQRTFHLKSGNGPTLFQQDLPYSFPDS